MSDLIRRSDALNLCKAIENDLLADIIDAGRNPNAYSSDFVKGIRCRMDGLLDAAVAISSLPSADRPTEWIPVSEKLPKENKEVLMSLEWGIDIGEYRDGGWHSEWINHYDDDNVFAWMPLPESYKGGDSE